MTADTFSLNMIRTAVCVTVECFAASGRKQFTNGEVIAVVRRVIGDDAPREVILEALDDWCSFRRFVDDPEERRQMHRRQLAAMEAVLETATALGVEKHEPVLAGIRRRTS